MSDTSDRDATDPPDAIDSLAGWLIVAAGWVVLVFAWGLVFTFTVYAGPLGEAFGLSTLRVSSVFSIGTAAFLVAGGLIGVVAARMALRPVVAAAGIAVGIGVGAFQVVSSYLGLVVVFALIGAACGTLFVVVIALVPQWFDRYQGRAVGIVVSGNGAGVLVLPLAWVWLLDRMPFREAFAVVGAATVAVILVASLFARRPPGARAAGSVTIDRAWVADRLTDTSLVAALLGYPLVWGWYFVLSAGLVDILAGGGIDRTLAATAFGIIGGISVVSRVGSGWLADWVGARVTFAVGVLLATLGVFALPAVHTPVPMYLVLVVFGAGNGVLAALFSPIVVGRFAQDDATAVVGLFMVAEAGGAFLLPIAINLGVATTGSYTVPLLILGVVTLVGIALFHWGTRPPSTATR